MAVTKPLTPEDLGRIAADHVVCERCAAAEGGDRHCRVCFDDDCAPMPWPCDAARLYTLVLKQSALMAEWGLPCSCGPDFDVE